MDISAAEDELRGENKYWDRTVDVVVGLPSNRIDSKKFNPNSFMTS